MFYHQPVQFAAKYVALGVLLVGAVSGCASVDQYKAEECCPTDLRHTYGHCSNEAVRQMPCYTDEADFGVKPTVWRCNTSYRPASPCPCVDNCNCQPPSEARPAYEVIESPEIVQPMASPRIPAGQVPNTPVPAPESMENSMPYEGQEMEQQDQELPPSETPFDFSGMNESRPSNPFRQMPARM